MPVGPPEDSTLRRFFHSGCFILNTGGAAMGKNALLETAYDHFEKGHYKKAMECFEQDLCFTHKPGAISCYALCVAYIEKNYENAISLCTMAAKKEFYNPEIYFNLGRILTLSGQKAFAFKAYRKGLRIDGRHRGLINALREMGIRRKPLIPFLSRKNLANKFLGVISRKFTVT
jgi:tetratricopeptide (TPR) repeat protein